MKKNEIKNTKNNQRINLNELGPKYKKPKRALNHIKINLIY